MPTLASVLMASPRGVEATNENRLTQLEHHANWQHGDAQRPDLCSDGNHIETRVLFVGSRTIGSWSLSAVRSLQGQLFYGICCSGRNIVWGNEFKEIQSYKDRLTWKNVVGKSFAVVVLFFRILLQLLLQIFTSGLCVWSRSQTFNDAPEALFYKRPMDHNPNLQRN